MTTPQNIWRIFLRPHGNYQNEFGFCYQRNIIGIGWPIDEHPGNDKEKYLQLAANKWRGEDDRGLEISSHAICTGMNIGDIVWVKNHEDWRFYLGEITGDWEYRGRDESEDPDAENEYNNADIVSIRPCILHEVRATDVGHDAGAFFETLQKSRFGLGTTIERFAKEDSIKERTPEIWEKIQSQIQADKH